MKVKIRMAVFKERFAEAMKMKNIRQTQVSTDTGIPKSTLSRYLKGSYEPKTDNLHTLAAYFGVTEAWLTGHNNDPTNPRYELVPEEEKREKTLPFSSLFDLLLAKTDIYKRIPPAVAAKIPAEYIECYPDSIQDAFAKWYISGMRTDGAIFLIFSEKHNILNRLKIFAHFLNKPIEEIVTSSGVKSDFIERVNSREEDDIKLYELSFISGYLGIRMNCLISPVINQFFIQGFHRHVSQETSLHKRFLELVELQKHSNFIISYEEMLKIAAELSISLSEIIDFDYFLLTNTKYPPAADEQTLLKNYRLLNQDGKSKSQDYVQDLTDNKKYLRGD